MLGGLYQRPHHCCEGIPSYTARRHRQSESHTLCIAGGARSVRSLSLCVNLSHGARRSILTHMDLREPNVLISENGLEGIIDWEYNASRPAVLALEFRISGVASGYWGRGPVAC